MKDAMGHGTDPDLVVDCFGTHRRRLSQLSDSPWISVGISEMDVNTMKHRGHGGPTGVSPILGVSQNSKKTWRMKSISDMCVSMWVV